MEYDHDADKATIKFKEYCRTCGMEIPLMLVYENPHLEVEDVDGSMVVVRNQKSKRNIKVDTFEGPYLLSQSDVDHFNLIREQMDAKNRNRLYDYERGYISLEDYEDYASRDVEEASDAVADYCYDHGLDDLNVSAIMVAFDIGYDVPGTSCTSSKNRKRFLKRSR
ncbi:MAG: hypothetical protein E7Z63_01070 [Thermoplasmata archaeon]|nr:hypothetical protein [Thermoplasmata archaeon]